MNKSIHEWCITHQTSQKGNILYFYVQSFNQFNDHGSVMMCKSVSNSFGFVTKEAAEVVCKHLNSAEPKKPYMVMRLSDCEALDSYLDEQAETSKDGYM